MMVTCVMYIPSPLRSCGAGQPCLRSKSSALHGKPSGPSSCRGPAFIPGVPYHGHLFYMDGRTAEHDVHEWVSRCLTRVRPSAFQGTWQARQAAARHMQVTDSGATFTPLVLHLPAAEGDWHLQELIWQWEAQASQHALHHSPQLLCLCLARYGHHDGAAHKNCSVVRFGHESVACATFTDPNSLTVTQTEYRIQSVIVHLGQSTRHGHYTEPS